MSKDFSVGGGATGAFLNMLQNAFDAIFTPVRIAAVRKLGGLEQSPLGQFSEQLRGIPQQGQPQLPGGGSGGLPDIEGGKSNFAGKRFEFR